MIDSIRLQNFRSYDDESFEFENGVNIVVGPNASGKTNLLESVLVLASGKSYRTKDVDLVKHSKLWSRAEGNFGNQQRILKLAVEGEQIIKTITVDDKEHKRLSLNNIVPTVFFEPNHLQLITRGPDQRREFIDDLLERSRIEFKSLSTKYRRTLAQRNALLKFEPHRAAGQLFAWDVRLAELGGKIAESRSELITQINKVISKDYGKIAGKKSIVEIVYDSHFPIESYGSRFLSKLETNAQTDIARGFTTYGPHREDIMFYLNGKLIGQTASRGEARSLMLAMKVYELGLIEKVYGRKPILLLDDVFSELDSARRRALVEYLKDNQTIITTTDADAVIEYFSGENNLISLSNN